MRRNRPGLAEQLGALRSAEAWLIARRAMAPDPVGAVAEAVRIVCGDRPPPEICEAGRLIAEAVDRHGRSFSPLTEPPYHDRYHQAEVPLAVAWLARDAMDAGKLEVRAAARCVLAMAGHDLLHDGTQGPRPAALEEHSAAETSRLASCLPEEDVREISRLIMATVPHSSPPSDLSAHLVVEADLFASLTPTLGWRLSDALARERRAAGEPDAEQPATFVGRLTLLRMIPDFSAHATALGLAAGRRLQVEAMAVAASAGSADAGAAALDALPREDACRLYRAALAEPGLSG